MASRANNQAKLHKQCEQFVLNMYRSFEDEPQKLKTFIQLFHNTKKQNLNVLESQMKLVDLIQDFPDLVRQLNQLVPDDFKVPELDIQDFPGQEDDEKMDINTIFTELHKRRPDKVQALISLIQTIKSSQNEDNNKKLKKEVTQILEDEPALLNAFMKYLEPTNDKRSAIMDEELDANNASFSNLEDLVESDNKRRPKPKLNRFEKVVVTKRFQTQRGFRRKEIDTTSVQITVTREEKEAILPSTLRNELYLFEYLEKNLNPKMYEELIKIIYLYSECLLSPVEVFQMAKKVFEGNENYFTFFQEIIHNREQIRRKNTILFKPLSDIDFKKLNCERFKSYIKPPLHFPYTKIPLHSKNPKSHIYLNKTWVSVPTGSEVNFAIGTKNSYEVTLFTYEDERYEFDTAIYHYNMTVKWLNSLDTLPTDEERSKLADRILKLKVVQKVYGNNSDIIDMFRKNPTNVAKVLLERVQIKLQELRDTKWNQAKKKWHEMAAQNFHRSLDHRSFFFKQSEKKLTNHKNFTAEAQVRHKDLNILNNFEKCIKYWSLLDTYDGLSNGQSCKHSEADKKPLMELPSSNFISKKVLPIYKLSFSDKKIIQDIFDILYLKVQNFHATLNEKDKITRYLKVLMTELLNLPCKPENTYENIPDQNALLAAVSKIESKIYTKSFSFNTSKMNDGFKPAIGGSSNALSTKMASEKDKDKTKKSDMEIESKNKNNSADKIDSEFPSNKEDAESSEDELRLDSVSEEQVNVKEMDYSVNPQKAESIFIPEGGEGQRIFYGTQHVYCLIRFYFTLYERFTKARELANEFEDNVKTKLLSQEEKDKLAEERYSNFKTILVHLIKSSFDNEKYEDLLRSMFGNKAYLLFYIDKIVHSIIVTTQKLAGDDITVKTLNLFTESNLLVKHSSQNKNKNNPEKTKNWPELVYLAQLNHLTLRYMNVLQNTTFFRFLYNSETQLTVISLHDSPYKDWKDKSLEQTIGYSEGYISGITNENHISSSKNLVFLNRNKETNRKKTVANLIKIVHTNDIEWKYVPNTQKLVTDKVHQEECLIIAKKDSSIADKSRKKVLSQVIKLQRLRAWHKKEAKL